MANATKGNCSEGLKQCGILDTIGNKLCLPEEYDCPINDIFIDLKKNNRNDRKYNYKSCHYYILPYTTNYAVYYTNENVDGNILSSLLNTTTIPCFIGNHCFVFDAPSFENRFKYQIYYDNETKDHKIMKEAIRGEPNSSYKYFESYEKYQIYDSWFNISEVKIAINKEDLDEKFESYFFW